MVLKNFSPMAIVVGLGTPSVAQFGWECFNRRPTFDCSSFILSFCEMISAVPLAPADTITRCFNIPDTSLESCEFIIETTASVTTTPDPLTCLSVLTIVFGNCPPGGAGQFTNVTAGGTFVSRFWIDPNAINCGVAVD
ncbi:hypothetical protein C8R45DRAFT_1105114 [Mycena sanguinolenta]|nr:hypothetical protein C8R45DRAFT_1105114 [Mycena sanguinolenta]